MRHVIPLSIITLLLGQMASPLAAAELARHFASHMVLQRDRPVRLWGTGEAGERVTVTFGGKVASATVVPGGTWEATLPAFGVSAIGRELVFCSGKAERRLRDVLVGDVWIVAGQSNAEMTFGWGVLDGEAERATANAHPGIRAMKVGHEESLVPVDGDAPCGPWRVCTREALQDVTALGWFFARDINGRTGIPIGLLDVSWSASRIDPFVNREGLRAVPGLSWAEGLCASRLVALRDWAERPEGLSPVRVPASIPFGTRWNAMVAPLRRVAVAGVIWYQGCSNAGEKWDYALKLEALVKGWRAFWGESLPFCIVQLAGYGHSTEQPAGGDGFASVRQAQFEVFRRLPQTGLAVALDLGDPNDIHPKNKQDLAARVALWARRDVYGEKALVPSGPLYRESAREGNRLRVRFDFVGSGLMAAAKDPHAVGQPPQPMPGGALRGFALLGEDGNWHWATAVIDGRDVVVSADGVREPRAVRYAYRANPAACGGANLYNREGLPAAPFSGEGW